MAILFTCKRGFENDLYDELIAFGCDPRGLKFKKKQGWILYRNDAHEFAQMRVVDFVFVSQLTFAAHDIFHLPEDDRAAPIARTLIQVYQSQDADLVYRDLHIGHIENEGQAGMGKFCQRLKQPLENKLKREGFKKVYSKTAVPNIHVFFHSFEWATIGLGLPRQSATSEWGVPRLKMPGDAPSRSTLKLEEAILTLMTERERNTFFVEGMRAVDLGACPGGWTYQLVKRGLMVTAIDNGSMDERLMKTGLVDHLLIDAFKFEPRRPVDWLVCDVVEQPQRISKLVKKWLNQGWCDRAVVNFKLPMHRRWATVVELMQAFSEFPICRFRQLYHDRAEVTAFISRSALEL